MWYLVLTVCAKVLICVCGPCFYLLPICISLSIYHTLEVTTVTEITTVTVQDLN